MVDPEAVSVDCAAAFLTELFGGDGAEVTDVTHLGTGAWSKAFAFRHATAEVTAFQRAFLRDQADVRE